MIVSKLFRVLMTMILWIQLPRIHNTLNTCFSVSFSLLLYILYSFKTISVWDYFREFALHHLNKITEEDIGSNVFKQKLYINLAKPFYYFQCICMKTMFSFLRTMASKYLGAFLLKIKKVLKATFKKGI